MSHYSLLPQFSQSDLWNDRAKYTGCVSTSLLFRVWGGSMTPMVKMNKNAYMRVFIPYCFSHQQITEALIRMFQTERGRGRETT